MAFTYYIGIYGFASYDIIKNFGDFLRAEEAENFSVPKEFLHEDEKYDLVPLLDLIKQNKNIFIDTFYEGESYIGIKTGQELMPYDMNGYEDDDSYDPGYPSTDEYPLHTSNEIEELYVKLISLLPKKIQEECNKTKPSYDWTYATY